MSADGFLVTGCDGPLPRGGNWNALPRCPQLGNMRPDAWGIAPVTGEFAFGEAKTCSDIYTVHTRNQLSVFGRVVQRDLNTACRLYFAVPRSAAYALDRVLGRAGLLGAPHIVRLHIPDCLVEDTVNDDR